MAAAHHPEERQSFSRALLDGQVYVSPTAMPDETGRIAGVHAADTPNGHAAAVFTSPERLVEQLGPDALVLANTGRALLEWLRPGPVVLNPGGDYGVFWSGDDLGGLLDGMIPETLKEDTQVLLGRPTEEPAELIARLGAALRAEPSVAGAWLMLAHRADKEASSWMLGVLHTGDWTAVQAVMRPVLQDFAFDRPLDALSLNDLPGHALMDGIDVLAATRPRKRRLFGLFG